MQPDQDAGHAHDDDCASVMTYCSTFGTRYLWYGGNQVAVYQFLYQAHAKA